MTILVGVMIALGTMFLFLPAGVAVPPKTEELFNRIDHEQHFLVMQAFREQASPKWPGLRRLQRDRRLKERLAGWVGLDMERLAASLIRLEWNVSVEQILLLRALGVALFVTAAGLAAYLQANGNGENQLYLWPLGVGFVLFQLPAWIVETVDKQVKAEVEAQIPVFFSLVLSLVEAGMPIFSALQATAERFDGRLGREFARLELDAKRHGNWRVALEKLAFQWDLEPLVAIISAVNEAYTKGTSVATVLGELIEEQLRRQEDEAAAHMNRLTVRLLPPLILLMGVPLLFLVMGPSFLGMKDQF